MRAAPAGPRAAPRRPRAAGAAAHGAGLPRPDRRDRRSRSGAMVAATDRRAARRAPATIVAAAGVGEVESTAGDPRRRLRARQPPSPRSASASPAITSPSLRSCEPPVIARTRDGSTVLDLRTVDPGRRRRRRPRRCADARRRHRRSRRPRQVVAGRRRSPAPTPTASRRNAPRADHRPRLRPHDAAQRRGHQLHRRARPRAVPAQHAGRRRRRRCVHVRGRRHRGVEAAERGAPAHPRAGRARATASSRSPRSISSTTSGGSCRSWTCAIDSPARSWPTLRSCRSARPPARGSTSFATRSMPWSTRTPAAIDRGRPRLWVDRVFAAKGSGTVVTGTLTGGSLQRRPTGARRPAHAVRIRAMQSHGAAPRLDRAGQPRRAEPRRRRPHRAANAATP